MCATVWLRGVLGAEFPKAATMVILLAHVVQHSAKLCGFLRATLPIACGSLWDNTRRINRRGADSRLLAKRPECMHFLRQSRDPEKLGVTHHLASAMETLEISVLLRCRDIRFSGDCGNPLLRRYPQQCITSFVKTFCCSRSYCFFLLDRLVQHPAAGATP
jgi:hypothetical protein